MAICSCCRDDLSSEEFNRCSQRPSGHQSYCRGCERTAVREGSRRLRQSPEYRKAEVEHQKAAYRADPEYRARKLARSRARRALERGELVRAPCPCGNPDSELHIEDYSKPLEVTWLCRPHRLAKQYGPERKAAPLRPPVSARRDPIAEVLRRFDSKRALPRVA